MRTLALLVLAGCGRIGFDQAIASVEPAEFLDGYQRRKQIRIAPLISTDVDDVTFSVFLSDQTDLAESARADGSDLIVTDTDGVTVLGHEIVSYEPSPGRVDLWIRLPALSASQPTIAYLYYDGPPVVRSSAWPSLYRGVWHMTDLEGGRWPDSVGGHDGLQPDAGLRPAVFGGIRGNSANYDGMNDTIEIADPADGSLDFAMRSFAYSLWVNVDQTSNEFDVVLCKGGFDGFEPGYDIELGNNDWEALLADGSTGVGARFGDASTFVGNGWFQLLVVVDRQTGELRTYVDGTLTDTTDISGLGSVDSDLPIELGRSVDHFRDLVDEIRIYEGVPELERLAIEHANFTKLDAYSVLPEEQR